MQDGVFTMGSSDMFPGLCTVGLRLRASSTLAAQSSHEDMGNVLYVVATWGGGGLSGTVVLAGGCDMLALHITEFEVGVGASWGSSCGPWGSTTVLGVHASPCALPSSSYPGCWGLHAWFSVLVSSRPLGLCSFPFGLPLMSLGSNPSSSHAEMHSSRPLSRGHVLASSSPPVSLSPVSSSFVSSNMVRTFSSFLPSPLILLFVLF